MDKPITVARQELVEQIVKDINEAGLPAFIVVDVLKECLAATEQLAAEQLRADLAAYKKPAENPATK